MIAIIDYGMGNLGSVRKAMERVGGPSAEIVVTSDAATVRRANKLILPGVGAFGDAMSELRSRGLVDPIREVIAADRPFLGICLGLQMLFETGYETGVHRGLGVIPGEVIRLERPREFPVPHIDWNQIERPPQSPPNPLLNEIPDGTFFYFVHSYHVVPKNTGVIAAETDYGGRFCAMIRRGNLYACQFHPEKSQSTGLRLLRNFAEL